MMLSPELVVEHAKIMAHMRRWIDRAEPGGKSLVLSHAQKQRFARERAEGRGRYAPKVVA